MTGEDKAWLGLAAVALGWGLAKGLVYGARYHHGCPAHDSRQLTNPKHVLKSVVLGPVLEEVQFRGALQPTLGLGAAAALFGASHLTNARHTGVEAATYQSIDAGLGGVLYGTAYEEAGLGAAIACHVLHNLGSDLGLAAALRRKTRP